MPDAVNPADEKMFIDRYGLNATDLGFFSGVSYGQCKASQPPSVQAIESAKAMQQPDLYLYDDSADPESSCTSQAFYRAMIRLGAEPASSWDRQPGNPGTCTQTL